MNSFKEIDNNINLTGVKRKYKQEMLNDLIAIEDDKRIIKDISFNNCDLSELDLSNIHFINCSFIETNLISADLTSANLTKANLSGVIGIYLF